MAQFVDRPLPEGLVLPMLRERPRDKRLDNLKHEGRRKGSQDKICRNLKEGCLEAAINVGRDGHGTDGLIGFLEDLAMHHKKAFCSLLVKMMPLQASVDVSTASVSQISIVSVPADHYFVPGSDPSEPGTLKHMPFPDEPPARIEPSAPEPSPSLSALESKLLALGHDELFKLAEALNVGR